MSKGRKKYNPLKHRITMGQQALRHHAMVFIAGQKFVRWFDLRKMQDVEKGPNATVQQFLDFAWPWTIELSVICRDQSGNEYVSSEVTHCQSAYRHEDPRLLEFLNKEHQKFIKSQNSLHMITASWIAVPRLNAEFDIAKLEAIYRQYGAFEFLSKWEHEQQKAS